MGAYGKRRISGQARGGAGQNLGGAPSGLQIARIATHSGVRTHPRGLEAMLPEFLSWGEGVYFKGFTLMLLMCTSLPGS
jgi:hypothetical protein